MIIEVSSVRVRTARAVGYINLILRCGRRKHLEGMEDTNKIYNYSTDGHY